MKDLQHFYETQRQEQEQYLEKIVHRIQVVRLFRFAIFLGFVAGFYFIQTLSLFPILLAILGISVFAFLVIQHQNLKDKKKLTELKIAFNTNEVSILNGSFHDRPDGKEYINPLHYYSNDVDLFGKGSFFQYINRTTTKEGKDLLSYLLTENNIHAISKRQAALQELSQKSKWRENFTSLAQFAAPSAKKTENIASWILNFESKLPSFLRFLPSIFSGISLLIIGLLILGKVPFSLLIAWFFIGLGITASNMRKTQSLYTSAGKAKEVFQQYYLLLEEIEKENFSSENLQAKQNEIAVQGKKASAIFKSFASILHNFDQRNNLIVTIFGNGLFLWEIHHAMKTEQWINSYKKVVEKWFKVIHFFDAYNSLAGFVFNHPNYTFPSIANDHAITGSNLGHPLLKVANRIDNDFTIDKEQFFIITGANMAGKSTFLRTVSLAIIMANCGLPVCANSFHYTPIKLITSMRTSDSLTDDESYFYAELKRLKFIVDEIKKDTYFIILDEILKGTNSQDKAAGSKQFIEKLTQSKSTGIIATHDVSLCALAADYTQIQNFYFDAEIVNNELYFDYKMKDGVCKNMNASFLLKKMEIV